MGHVRATAYQYRGAIGNLTGIDKTSAVIQLPDQAHLLVCSLAAVGVDRRLVSSMEQLEVANAQLTHARTQT